MRVETDSNTNTISYVPADGTQSATVILMHGLGDSGDGLREPMSIGFKEDLYIIYI